MKSTGISLKNSGLNLLYKHLRKGGCFFPQEKEQLWITDMLNILGIINLGTKFCLCYLKFLVMSTCITLSVKLFIRLWYFNLKQCIFYIIYRMHVVYTVWTSWGKIIALTNISKNKDCQGRLELCLLADSLRDSR